MLESWFMVVLQGAASDGANKKILRLESAVEEGTAFKKQLKWDLKSHRMKKMWAGLCDIFFAAVLQILAVLHSCDSMRWSL